MNERECREALKERAAGRCERCGKYIATTLHHRIKRSHLSKSNQWRLSNVVALCGNGTMKCHGEVEANPNESEKTGFHLRPWSSTEAPILLHGRKWVRLDEHIPQYNLVVDEGEKS